MGAGMLVDVLKTVPARICLFKNEKWDATMVVSAVWKREVGRECENRAVCGRLVGKEEEIARAV